VTDEARVVLYGTRFCPYCIAAKKLLKKKGVRYEDILVSTGEMRREIEQRSGQRTVPQIFINDKSIGGFDELYGLEEDGLLDAMLQQA
jgi:glutaredoxin 3